MTAKEEAQAESSKRSAKPVIKINGTKRFRSSSTSTDVLPLKREENKYANDGERREVEEAALTLCMMKHSSVDEETFEKLHNLVKTTRNLAKKVVSDDDDDDYDGGEDEDSDHAEEYVVSCEHRRPCKAKVVKDGDRSCVKGLEGIMGECGRPFEKVLVDSDVADVQARLNLRKESVTNHLLPLLTQGEDLTRGIPVTTYNATGIGFPMVFKRWSEKSNVLTSGWNKFVRANNFKALRDRSVTVQGFRHAHTGQLCFFVGLVGN